MLIHQQEQTLITIIISIDDFIQSRLVLLCIIFIILPHTKHKRICDSVNSINTYRVITNPMLVDNTLIIQVRYEPAIIMANVNVTVKSIRVYSDGNSMRYRVSFEEVIDGFIKNNDNYEDGKVDYIDFDPKHFIAICINCIDDLDVFYSRIQEQYIRGDRAAFGIAELQVILKKAKLEIDRTKHVAGEEFTDYKGEVKYYEHDGYNKNILSIELSDKAQSRLDKFIDKMFS